MDNKALLKLAEKKFNVNLDKVEIFDAECVSAISKNGNLKAGGSTIPEKLRALMLHAKNYGSDFELIQPRKFRRLGAMIDMSRGGVMRVEKVKEFIEMLAFYGADYAMLYTEDVYELEEYPHFGYLRGRYTDSELMEIDAYASELGIEMIPCIQTLGHMEKYLSWKEAAPVKDTASVLLADAEETYELIECMIKKMRKVFKSESIHIGMDETFDLGLGNYLRKNGYCDKGDIYFRHLNKVIKICEKYDFKPMIWTDMLFRLNGTDYWDMDFVFSEEAKAQIPDVKLVYWEYGETREELYDKMINIHRQLKKPLSFAGGIWTFKGFLPDTFNKSLAAAMPALRACIKNGVEDVMATIWGDDGCETDYFYALYSFAAYAEACYSDEFDISGVEQMGEFVSGYPTKLMKCCDAFFFDDFEIYGRTLIYGDVFLNLGGYDWKNFDRLEIIRKAANDIPTEYEYEKLVMNVALKKAELYANLMDDYKSGKDLSEYADVILPGLKDDYEKLFEIYAKRWNEINKPFGFEKLSARFGACILRLKYATDVVKNYCLGKTDAIEELEYTPLYGEKHGIGFNQLAMI